MDMEWHAEQLHFDGASSMTGVITVPKAHARHGFTIVELLIMVIVIAILAAITIVAFNNVTNRAKDSARASTLAQWKKKSEVQKIQNNIDCADGYAFVYGNSALGTSDFCVMKYEAKNDGSGNAVSTASGSPWVSIAQSAAIAAATAAGGHLITEAEWMTIAADVLSVSYNWTGGKVGSGYIFKGHINNNPGSALAASTDDSDALNGITGGTGTTVDRNGPRVLYLSSGDTIWDFSGNVYEWTQQAVGTPTLTMNQVGVSGDAAWSWREWTLGSLSLGNLATSSRPSTLASIDSLSGVSAWGSAQGVGMVYANYADTGTRAFRRGGFYASGSSGGVMTVATEQPSSYSASSLGFRVAR
ncbi:type IV pilin protein [Microbacterium sp. ASV49]|uniref:Prepilin-type N-terminal cleavage/methylation domain-containing protein n=1 Tax=Microbacterium candidum TaxID=3041922 RepID=A0ABT7N051_9MICO|nr:hypothetical protein [Microbacterium sp. ASV49]MDL9980088.1 hypothetical protein [Microbacterium sp. ASV49]